MSRTAVLRPRCWSGRKSTFSPCSNAHSRARSALEEVQMVPPCRPVNALMSAEEFMYETGHGDVGDPGVGQHVPALGDLLGGGHVGHRAAGRQVGQDHLLVGRGQDVGGLGHEVHAAEDDVLRLRAGRRVPGQLEGVAGDVGELDDLVALVVVAEDEDPVAERAPWPRGRAPPGPGRTAAGRSPGHSTPRSLRGSASRPSSSRASGVGCTSSGSVVVTGSGALSLRSLRVTPLFV